MRKLLPGGGIQLLSSSRILPPLYVFLLATLVGCAATTLDEYWAPYEKSTVAWEPINYEDYAAQGGIIRQLSASDGHAEIAGSGVIATLFNPTSETLCLYDLISYTREALLDSGMMLDPHSDDRYFFALTAVLHASQTHAALVQDAVSTISFAPYDVFGASIRLNPGESKDIRLYLGDIGEPLKGESVAYFHVFAPICSALEGRELFHLDRFALIRFAPHFPVFQEFPPGNPDYATIRHRRLKNFDWLTAYNTPGLLFTIRVPVVYD